MPRAARESTKERARLARKHAYQEAILEAAEHLFAAQGVEATKMEDIATQAGLSLRTLYSAIDGGKSELVETIWRNRLADLRGVAENAFAADQNPRAKLRDAFWNATEYFLAHPDFLQMQMREGHSWGIRSAVAVHSSAGAESFRDGVGSIEAIVEEGRTSGAFEVEKSSLSTYSIVALQQIHLAQWLSEGLGEDLDTVFARFWSDVEKLLGLVD